MSKKSYQRAKLFLRGPGVVSRFAQMHADVLYQSNFPRGARTRTRVFNLDLHISVIADLEVELKRRSIDLTRWSISGHNFVQRKRFASADPVRVVNARSWRQLDENMIDAFQDAYGTYLRTFDGFIACYSPTFVELFRGLDRPVLALVATRYEAPYTHDPVQWTRFNHHVRTEVNSGRLLLAANNRGDRDYCEYFTGVTPRLVPSLCDYPETSWTGSSGPMVVKSSDANLKKQLTQESGDQWLDSDRVLRSPYSWGQLFSVGEMFTIPYNVSTMTLFELATAGVPVSVPSRRFLKQLAGTPGSEACSQLTWYQVHGSAAPLDPGNPNNSARPDFLDWWLDRADFYDSDLMPNIREVDSIQELLEKPHPVRLRSIDAWMQLTETRNAHIARQRRSLLDEFLRMMS